MSKRRVTLDLNSLYKLDNSLYYFIAISIFFISFINRVKVFTSYYSYDFQNSLGNVFNAFTYYKLLGLIVLFIISLAAFIYRCVNYHIKLELDAVTIGILLIIISSIIATLFSGLPDIAIWGFYSRSNGLLAYISLFGLLLIITKLNIKDEQLIFLSRCVNGISIIIIIIGIMEFFGHNIFAMEWYKSLYIPRELKSVLKVKQLAPPFMASSLLGQPNYFGAFCSIVFPFITIQAIDAKKWLDKISFSIGSVMLFIGTYISVSMGPLITLLAVLLLMIISFRHWRSYVHIAVLLLLYSLSTSIFIKYHIKNTPWVIKEFIGLIKAIFSYKFAILAIPAVALLIIYYKNRSINKYKLVSIIIILTILASIVGFIFILQNVVPNNMGMLSNRGYAWHYTYQMLKQNFIIGYGPDTFYYNFPQINPDTEKYSKGIVFDKPHNMYLQVFVDNGLLGIAGFMILLVSTLLLLLKATYSSTNSNIITYSKAAFFATIAYATQGITNDNHMVIQPILYLLIATGVAISKKENQVQN